MKRWLVALVLIAAVLCALPWWTGVRTEQRVRELVDAAAGDWLTIEAYDRGWWASQAWVNVGDGPAGYQLRAHLAHGPLPLAADALAHWRPALVHVRSELQPLESRSGLRLSSHYTLELDGGQFGRIEVLPLEYDDEHFAVDSQGAQLHYEASKFLDEIHARLQAKPFSAQVEGLRIRLQSLHANAHLQEGTLGGDLMARVDSVVWEDESLGSGKITVSVANLGAAATVRLLQHAVVLSSQGLRGRALAASLLGSFLVESAQLLQYQPRLELQGLALSAPEGEFRAQGYLTVNSRNPTVLRNSYLLTRAMEARLQIRVPQALARRLASTLLDPQSEASNKLGRYAAAGALKVENGAYVAEIRYTGGQLVVNGKPWGAIRRAVTLHRTPGTITLTEEAPL